MTFLPVVERELRVAARRRASHLVRLAEAAVGSGAGTDYIFASLAKEKLLKRFREIASDGLTRGRPLEIPPQTVPALAAVS